MTHFPLEIQRVLAANGWQEDRHMDTSEYERALLAAGYAVCKPVCDFLQRYGDLEVVASEEYASCDTCLNTCLSEIMKTRLVSGFSKEVGRPLYCIGKCSFDFMYLLMDDAGRVYRHLELTSQNFGGIDLYLIAASGEEAIEKLILESLSGVDIPRERVAHQD